MKPVFMRAFLTFKSRVREPALKPALKHYKQEELLPRFGVYQGQLYKPQRKHMRVNADQCSQLSEASGELLREGGRKPHQGTVCRAS
jgi:hypothetical protein